MKISINTAQNVDINYQPAGLLPRITATIIDLLLLAGLFLLLLFILGGDYLSENMIGTILITILFSLYHLLSEFFFNGQSIGKLTQNLRVVRLDGHKLSLWDCLLRWSLRLIDITMSLGIVAGISILFSSKMQRLGDLAAGTTVIVEKPTTTSRLFDDYDTPKDYEVTFPQVTLLSDKDISTIKEVLKEAERHREFQLLEPLATKIKELTGLETSMNNLLFIQTVIKDYIHLTKS